MIHYKMYYFGIQNVYDYISDESVKPSHSWLAAIRSEGLVSPVLSLQAGVPAGPCQFDAPCKGTQLLFNFGLKNNRFKMDLKGK